MVASGSITVAVRIRPPNAWESSRLPEICQSPLFRGDGALSAPSRLLTLTSGLTEVVKAVDDRILLFDPAESDSSPLLSGRGFLPPGTKRFKDKRFMFDRVFNTEASQIDIHEATSRPLLDGLLDGYNATVFAYGATGCGKTYTISGTDGDPGIVYLTMADLFQKIERKRDEYIVDINVTFLEVYNEEIRDLLADPSGCTHRGGGLQIREDKAVKVVGLVELHPTSADQIKEIVALGNSRRTQSPTHANETSSRSHAVLQINLVQSPKTASNTEERSMATLSIIDLAGSERAAATNNMGQRMVEGANINKSLLALGNCINALCESGGATRHVPYRNSKLTRLLKFSLGGNCRTVMIVCIAPTSNHYDDTHNTLLYASRASKIKTKVVTRNVVNVDRHVGQYVEAINRLNVQVAELKAKLSGKIKVEEDILRRKQEDAQAEIRRVKGDIARIVNDVLPSILDGASDQGKIVFARARLQSIQCRLSQLNDGPHLENKSVHADILAEKNILQALSSLDDSVIKEGSNIMTRLHRAQNSYNLFNATMRAILERRMSNVDELCIENRSLLVQLQKAEVEKQKYEVEKKILQDHLATQASVDVEVLGALARCMMLVNDGARLLRDGTSKDLASLEHATTIVSNSLQVLAESIQISLAKLTGKNPMVSQTESASALVTLEKEGLLFPSQTQLFRNQNRGMARRASATTAGSTARRAHISSPKKKGSRMSAEAGRGTTRRVVSDKVSVAKKSVQWQEDISYNDDVTIKSSGTNGTAQPSRSTGSSESDWEDEKVENNLYPQLSFVNDTEKFATRSTAKSRPSRFESQFLSSKNGMTSKFEGSSNADYKNSHANPFADRLNQLCTVPASGNSYSECQQHYPADDSSSEFSRSRKRKSHIGPLRSEKVRRRSSLLPHLSTSRDTELLKGKRPVHSHTPKRLRRASIQRPASLKSSVRKGSSTVDPNGSSDLSFKVSKPFWR